MTSTRPRKTAAASPRIARKATRKSPAALPNTESHLSRRARKNLPVWENLFKLTHKYIESNFYDGTAIFVSDALLEKDLVTAIALKHFFQDNGIHSEIIIKKEHLIKNGVNPKYFSEFTEIPSMNHFLSYTIGCAHEYDIENDEYRSSVEAFNINTSTSDIIRFGVKNLIAADGICCVDVIYPEMKNSGLTISKEVITELYIAMLCATEKFERKVYSYSIKTMSDLLHDGADYADANARYGAQPLAVLECHSLMHKHLKVNGDMARIVIPYGEASEECTRLTWEKAVKAYRNTDNINIWCVQIEEDDGAYYSIVQTKANKGYDLTSVARRNNGNGTENFVRCIIYAFDLDKLTHDIRDMTRTSFQA